MLNISSPFGLTEIEFKTLIIFIGFKGALDLFYSKLFSRIH
jgi:hypothetical protein